MKFINPILACDSYKLGHKSMYPQGMTFLYSNLTPRSNRLAPSAGETKPDKLVFYGLQAFIKWFLIDSFNTNFFGQPKEKVLKTYNKRTDAFLGAGAVDSQHIADLWDLGYLPIEIKALPEGSLVDMKVPLFTIKNTHPNFGWLVNYLETALSAEIWKACTTATTAFEYKKILTKFAIKTGSPLDFVLWQGHDFSLRGLSGLMDAASSSGHLTSFLGSDTVPAADFIDAYYKGEETFVAGSVPASEHSVASANILSRKSGDLFFDEAEFFGRYITDIFPSGVVSYVSDTFSFWDVITRIAPAYKESILTRIPNALGLAKVVFRPDSGDPIKIICGDSEGKTEAERKGAIQCLWDTFGGTITSTGHKLLNERVGLIYGDSITLERANTILTLLEANGFASANVVFGIGSFTYQYVTRDSYGVAMKATYCEINGVPVELYKDPKTDDGTKKSAKGLLRVEETDKGFVLYDQQTPEQELQGVLQTVFKDSVLTKEVGIEEIRIRVASYLPQYL